jgi:hypothetical protein
MKTKEKQAAQEKKRVSTKKLALVSTALVAIIVSGALVSRFFLSSSEPEFSFKAAIVDQIGDSYPSNPESKRIFNETVTALLLSRGFNVTYYRSSNVTVDFYEGLAKYDYGLIILRAHSAVRLDAKTVDFFTSEPFNPNNPMLDSGLLSRGNYEWEPGKYYFAITPEFIESLDGYFPKSIIIATGCTSLNSTRTQMAQAFINKGAKAYIGWTDLVSMQYSDDTTTRFLQYLLTDNRTISQAANQCNELPDISYPGHLAYYPSNISNHKLADFTTKTTPNTPQPATQALPQKQEKHKPSSPHISKTQKT